MVSIFVEIPYDVYVHYGFSFMHLYFYCFKFTFVTFEDGSIVYVNL